MVFASVALRDFAEYEPGTVLMSDKQKGLSFFSCCSSPDAHIQGLTKAISSTFRRAFECFCVQHIKENVKTNFNAEVATQFTSTAYAETGDHYMNILQSTHDDFIEKAHEYLCKLQPSRFARFAVPVSRFGHKSSNIVQSVNGQLGEQWEGSPSSSFLRGSEIFKLSTTSSTTRPPASMARHPLFHLSPEHSLFLADEQKVSSISRVITETRAVDLLVTKIVSSFSPILDNGSLCYGLKRSEGNAFALFFKTCNYLRSCRVSHMDPETYCHSL